MSDSRSYTNLQDMRDLANTLKEENSISRILNAINTVKSARKTETVFEPEIFEYSKSMQELFQLFKLDRDSILHDLGLIRINRDVIGQFRDMPLEEIPAALNKLGGNGIVILNQAMKSIEAKMHTYGIEFIFVVELLTAMQHFDPGKTDEENIEKVLNVLHH
jgi:hypothetical protein